MGHYLLNQASLTIYDAPKTGGTTLRFWLYFYLTGELPSASSRNGDNIFNSYLYGGKDFSRSMKKLGYKQLRFQDYDSSDLKICLLRDPISRFISCFNDKLVSERKWKKFPSMSFPNDLEGFLNDRHLLEPSFKWRLKRKIGLGNDLNGNYLGYHFAPLSFHYGNNPDYYDHIFWTSDINTSFKPFLEERLGTSLPDLHTRNASTLNREDFLTLDDHNISLIREFCFEDYSSSWSQFWHS